MTEHFDSFCKRLLSEFFLADPRDWRLRHVLQINPVNPEAYRARTSYQFRVSGARLRRAWHAACVETGNHRPFPAGQEVQAIIPVDYLPKHVLLDFSLQDSDGKPLPLLPSGEINRLSLDMILAGVTSLDSQCPDQSSAAADFFRRSENIISALVSTGQREIQKRLEHLRAFSRDEPEEFSFTAGMLSFFEDALAQFTGDQRLADSAAEACRSGFRDVYRECREMSRGLRAALGGRDGYHSPLLNPALLIVEYFRQHPLPSSDRLDGSISDFLRECRQFLGALSGLADDELRFWPVTDVLMRMADYYIAYARMSVPIDRDFIVKMEQVIPVETGSWWRIWSWRYQRYPMRIGGSRSTHIEIICEHPVELEQVPVATRVFIGGKPLPIDVLFGRTDHSTKYHQHFYTNKNIEQIALSLQSHGVEVQRPLFNFILQIKYSIEVGTRWGYRLALIVASLASVVLLREFDPASLKPGEIRLVSLIPILTGLLGVLASLKPQENIVAFGTRKYKLFILLIAFLMTGYFIIGLVFPELVAATRGILKELVTGLRVATRGVLVWVGSG